MFDKINKLLEIANLLSLSILLVVIILSLSIPDEILFEMPQLENITLVSLIIVSFKILLDMRDNRGN